MVHNHQDVQEIINSSSKSAEAFWLKINLKKKKEVIYKPLLGSHHINQDTQIEVEVLTQVNKFKYLDSTVASDKKLDAELDTWTLTASKAFGRLRKRAVVKKDLSIKIKCAVYYTIVLISLQYETETWKADAQRHRIYMIHHFCKW